MPFGIHHKKGEDDIKVKQQQQSNATAAGILQAAQALTTIGSAAAATAHSSEGRTASGTDLLHPSSHMLSTSGSAQNYNHSAPDTPSDCPAMQQNDRMSLEPSAAPNSAQASAESQQQQQYNTPRRQHTHARLPSNAPPLQYTPQAYQQQPQPYTANPPPSFNIHQATPQGASQPASVLPSNAGVSNVPGSLQPGAGANARSATVSTGTGPAPNIQPHPIQTNAQQYTQSSQPPSRSNTHHSHSRSSPAGMDGLSSTGQKYIPFNQTPTQTPGSSNPKAYNTMSPGTPGGPSHSPLNLTDIRSRTVSDLPEPAMGTNLLFSPNESQTNSNYMAPFATYAFDWCSWPVQGGMSGAGKMAVGSYLEDPHNFIQILDTHIVPQDVTGPGQSPYGLEYSKVAEATCAYPVTRLLWEPPSASKQYTDLLATSGDHLRLWSLPASSNNTSSTINRSASVNTREPATQKLQPLALLSNSKTPEHTAPLTSLDWNKLSPKLIITSSIDTTCTIWDIPTLTAKTQLIAHDKEVFDVRFCSNSVDVFVSCGADGSVRMFDLRSLEHSTIIYEPAEKNDKSTSPTNSSPTKSSGMSPSQPLLRLAASPFDSHMLATFASDSNLIRILDVRQPGTALLELRGHHGNLNSIDWSPHQRGLLASGADDSLVMTWDLLNSDNQAALPSLNGNNGTAAAAAAAGEIPVKGPYSSWQCDYEVANVSFAPESMLTAQGGDWLGVCAGRGVWGVKL